MIAPGTAGAMTPAVPVWAKGYWSILLDPPGGTTPDGEAYSYTANDVGLGDLTATVSPIWC